MQTDSSYTQPYADLDVLADFAHDSGLALRRPAFWDGGNVWRLRFAPTLGGRWSWRNMVTADNKRLAQTGKPGTLPNPRTQYHSKSRGFWRMSLGKHNLVHADGPPALLVGDTACALPRQVTLEQCRIYARDRQQKGFSAALLMSTQPDMKDQRPSRCEQDLVFDAGCEDLPNGSINDLNPGHFQYLDKLAATLLEHEIVPVYQPLFHGYDWQALEVAEPTVPEAGYAHYRLYLAARYGARPTVYLVSNDGQNYHQQIGSVGGDKVERWDACAQPTSVYYRRHADNFSCQDACWLDLQWCQTDYKGEHVPKRVMGMWHIAPSKGVANGEPTYEHIGAKGMGVGWWQGHEVWSNLCDAGMIDVVYGAGSLWHWKFHKDKWGYQVWCIAPEAGWRGAPDVEGLSYVGLAAKVFEFFPFTDVKPDGTPAIGSRGLAVPGKMLLIHLAEGGRLQILSEDVPETTASSVFQLPRPWPKVHGQPKNLNYIFRGVARMSVLFTKGAAPVKFYKYPLTAGFYTHRRLYPNYGTRCAVVRETATQLSEIKPTNLREKVVEQVRQAIIEGWLKPGDHMVEAHLTRQLGVSRTPLREALILLEREGLVETVTNRGTFVRRYTESDIESIFSMRVTLENFAAERVIDQLGEADFVQLETLIDKQNSYIDQGDLKKVRATDMQFHRYLISRSDHPYLLRSWSEIVAQIAALLYLRAETTPNYDERRVVRDHHGILAAYRARELVAVRSANHLINARVAGECRQALRLSEVRKEPPDQG